MMRHAELDLAADKVEVVAAAGKQHTAAKRRLAKEAAPRVQQAAAPVETASTSDNELPPPPASMVVAAFQASKRRQESSSLALQSLPRPRRALWDAEQKALLRQQIEYEERNPPGGWTYGATRSPAAPGWMAHRANTAPFGSNARRFDEYWRAHRDRTPLVGGPAAYGSPCDRPGAARVLSGKASIGAEAAATTNPTRYGEMLALRSDTSEGRPEINDWWCDVATEGCLRPTANAVHGDCYPPGRFWYRENYCVCEACYRSGHAEDHHGYEFEAVESLRRVDESNQQISDAGSFVPGWLRSDYHKFLAFAGLQSKRESVERESDALREAKGEHEWSHRQRGADLQRAAEGQRERARQADAHVLDEAKAATEQVKEWSAAYAEHKQHVQALRAEYSLLDLEERASDAVLPWTVS